jgi:MgtC family
MFVDRFPPAEVAARIVVSLGIGLLVRIEREWSSKDLGIRTFALTSLLGTIAALFSRSMAVASSVGGVGGRGTPVYGCQPDCYDDRARVDFCSERESRTNLTHSFKICGLEKSSSVRPLD